jgi:hypothetical protein
MSDQQRLLRHLDKIAKNCRLAPAIRKAAKRDLTNYKIFWNKGA